MKIESATSWTILIAIVFTIAYHSYRYGYKKANHDAKDRVINIIKEELKKKNSTGN